MDMNLSILPLVRRWRPLSSPDAPKPLPGHHEDHRCRWWREWFGLSRGEAQALDLLYRRAGGVASQADLCTAAGLDLASSRALLDVVAQALDEDGLEVGPAGARLTWVGFEECQAALLQRIPA